MDAIVTQMIILFVLVIVGYYLGKRKMMDEDFDRKLSALVINVTCPSLILSSVMGDTLFSIYLMSALRLMVIPLFILCLSRLCRVDETIANINVVLAAMPVASYGTLFCIKYEKGELLMAEGTFITTLLSVLSIPLLLMFL